MTRSVITAVVGGWESDLITTLEATAGYTVARRCADLADLLAAAAAGIGDLALVSADLRSLDRPALHELSAHGVRVAGVTAPGDDVGEQHLRQLGLDVVVRADLASHELDDALAAISPERGTLRLDSADPGPEPTQPEVELGRLIAVWGPTGAPGRSTLALNLAAELAEVGPALLVDCDTYGASVAQALGMLDEAPGLAAAARAADHGALDLPALARVAPEVTPGLRVLTGLPRADRWSELRAPSVAQILALARRLAAFVVIDCGFAIEDDEELSYDTLAPRRNAATLTALEQADDLVVVGSADPVGLQRLVRAVQELGSITAPRPRLVVVNRVRASAVGSRPERRIAEALSRFAGMDDLCFVPHDLETLDAALFAGRSLREFAPHSEVRHAIAAVAQRYAGARADPTASRRLRPRRRALRAPRQVRS